MGGGKLNLFFFGTKIHFNSLLLRAFGVTWKANKVVALKPQDAKEEISDEDEDTLYIAIKVLTLQSVSFFF